MATLMRSATAAVAENWTQVLGKQLVENQGDRRLASDVRRAWRAAGYPALNRASVLISDGCVVLRGRVPSFHVKQIAQEIVMRVTGIRQVVNLLEVLDPGSSTRRAIALARQEVG